MTAQPDEPRMVLVDVARLAVLRAELIAARDAAREHDLAIGRAIASLDTLDRPDREEAP
jgi:hypothetical protein